MEGKRISSLFANPTFLSKLAISLLLGIVGFLIGWLAANPGFSFFTLILVALAAGLCLWLWIHFKTPVFYVGKIIFYFAIFTSFFGAAFFAVDLGPFSIFPFRIFLIFLLLLFVIHLIASRGKLIPNLNRVKLYLVFLLFWFVYALISLAWAASLYAAIRQIVFLFMGCSLIFFSVYYFRNLLDLEHLYRIWIIVLIILFFIGLWETQTLYHLPGSRLYKRRTYMPTAVFYNTNDFATFLSLSLPFTVSFIRYRKRSWLIPVGIAMAAGVIYLIIKTDSRANIIAILLELLFVFLFLIEKKQKLKVLIVLIIFGICSFIFFRFISKAEQNFFMKVIESLKTLGSQSELTVGSVAIRWNLIRDGFNFLYSTAGFGVGAGNAEYWMLNFAKYETVGATNPHNWWLEILVNYGIFIFAGYVVFYLGLIRGLLRAWRVIGNKKEKMICEALLVSLVGFFFASISPSSIMDLKPIWILFSFAIAFLNYYRINYSKQL